MAIRGQRITEGRVMKRAAALGLDVQIVRPLNGMNRYIIRSPGGKYAKVEGAAAAWAYIDKLVDEFTETGKRGE